MFDCSFVSPRHPQKIIRGAAPFWLTGGDAFLVLFEPCPPGEAVVGYVLGRAQKVVYWGNSLWGRPMGSVCARGEVSAVQGGPGGGAPPLFPEGCFWAVVGVYVVHGHPDRLAGSLVSFH